MVAMRRFIKNRTGAQATSAGGLKLLLSGFARQDVIAIDDIVTSIDRLPDFHLEGLREISYLPEGAPDASPFPYPVYPRCDPKGEFVQAERRIFVYGFDGPPRTRGRTSPRPTRITCSTRGRWRWHRP